MEILSGVGGGVLALFYDLFSVALVVLRRFRRSFCDTNKSGRKSLNLTKSKRSSIDFKAC